MSYLKIERLDHNGTVTFSTRQNTSVYMKQVERIEAKNEL